jgi:hypothetical protein
MVNGRLSAKTMWAVCAGVLLTALGTGATAFGQTRLLVPEQSPSGPYYARIERGYVHEANGWVAIAFYREPDCVRPNFNLLNFFDFTNIPAIFGCPLTIHGFELWDPDNDMGPKQARYEGNGEVPVWFVSVENFNAAMPGLTMNELRAMPSLMEGVATRFEETLHPSGGANRSMLRLVASGDLPDGRTFSYIAIEANGVLQHVAIEFR